MEPCKEAGAYVPLTASSSMVQRAAIWIIGAHLLIGSLVFSYIEGWSFVDSLYYCSVTVLTIGYGDFVPKSNAGKVCMIVYIIVGLSLIATCLGVLFGKLQDKIEARAKSRWHTFFMALLQMLACIFR